MSSTTESYNLGMISLSEWFGEEVGLLSLPNHLYSVVACSSVRVFEIPTDLLLVVLPPGLLIDLKKIAKLKMGWLKDRSQKINEVYSKIYALSHPVSSKPLKEEVAERQETLSEIQKVFPKAKSSLIQSVHDTQQLLVESQVTPTHPTKEKGLKSRRASQPLFDSRIVSQIASPVKTAASNEETITMVKSRTRPTSKYFTSRTEATIDSDTFRPHSAKTIAVPKGIRPFSARSAFTRINARPESANSITVQSNIRPDSAVTHAKQIDERQEIVTDSMPQTLIDNQTLSARETTKRTTARQLRPQTATSAAHLIPSGLFEGSPFIDFSSRDPFDSPMLDKGGIHSRVLSAYSSAGKFSLARYLKASGSPSTSKIQMEEPITSPKLETATDIMEKKKTQMEMNKIPLTHRVKMRQDKRYDIRAFLSKHREPANTTRNETESSTSTNSKAGSMLMISLKGSVNKALDEIKIPHSPTWDDIEEARTVLHKFAQRPSLHIYKAGKAKEIKTRRPSKFFPLFIC